MINKYFNQFEENDFDLEALFVGFQRSVPRLT